MLIMKTVNARQANHEFSDLLSRVERGEEGVVADVADEDVAGVARWPMHTAMVIRSLEIRIAGSSPTRQALSSSLPPATPCRCRKEQIECRR